MPINFSILQKMCDLTRHPKFCESYSNKELGAAIGGWSILNYDHLRCKYISLPNL
jgi:sentrin-specific protease 1